MSATLLVGTAVTREGAVGTLYRSVDGDDWKPADGIPVDTGVQSLIEHPNRKGTVFAATRAGVFKSTDSGASFGKLDVPSEDEFWSVTIHPENHDTIFVGTAPVSIYRSDDCGDSWRRVGSSRPMPELCDLSESKSFKHSRLMRLFFDPTNTNLLFGACETNGVIVSEDGGETWRAICDGLIALAAAHDDLKSAIVAPDEHEGMLDGHAVIVSRSKPGTVFYACRMGVFSSDDLGTSWRNHDVKRFAPLSYSRDLRLSVDDPNTFYLALSIASRSDSGALYRSTDCGETWQRCDAPVTAISTIMGMNLHATDPNRLIYVTRHGQVMWTEDRCATWNEKQLPENAGDAFQCAIL